MRRGIYTLPVLSFIVGGGGREVEIGTPGTRLLICHVWYVTELRHFPPHYC